MFERFDPDLRRVVISDAIDQATRRGDQRVGTEHLLIATARAPGAFGAAFFDDIGANHEVLADALHRLDETSLAQIGMLATPPPPEPNLRRGRWPFTNHVPFNGGAKAALRRSLLLATGRGDRSIRVEHLVLALTSGPDSDLAVLLLRRLGIDPAALHVQIERQLRSSA